METTTGVRHRAGDRVTRRELLRTAGLGVAGLAAAGASLPSRAGAQGAQGTPVRLVFIAGSYEPQLVRKNLDRFEQQYPNIKVDYTGEASITYQQKLTAILSTGARPLDLCYVGDEQLGGWAEAGWLDTLDARPEVAAYKKDLYPYVLQAMIYKGKLYGLPYYADYQAFAYNQKMLARADFAAPPATWDDVKTQGLALKKSANLEYPMVTGMLKGYPNSFGLYWSMVYGAGGSFFDKEMNPVYPGKDPAALAALEWLVEAMHTWKILDPKSIELNINQGRDALAAEQAVFSDISRYDLQRLNDASLSKIAGDAKMAPFPTFTRQQPGGSYGWVRMYSITKKSRHKDQAWTLLQYVGGKDREGKYHTAKNWNLIKGLGFGYTQLASDPDIIESTNKWGDIKLMNQQASLAKTRENIKTPWYAEWELFHQAQLQEALLKKASPRDALTASANRAMALRKEWS